MRLKPTSFLAIYKDGLVQLDGHEFDVGDRKLVVHHARPKLFVIDKDYKISERALGFSIPINPTRSRLTAAAFADDVVSKIGADEWESRCKQAAQARKSLSIVKG